MIFVWLQIPNVSKKYRTALIINGLVTGIATYHYFRIFNSWNDAFNVQINKENTGYNVTLSGQPFNDAYRYVDWLLTVPLLLIELVLVMGLSPEETSSKAWTLGIASALMVALGYPGEVQNGPGARLQWWAFAMIPFMYVVYTLAVGLEEATQKMEPQIASVVKAARWLTIISWLTYPCVYLIKTGLPGPTPTAEEQVGYSIADVVAKAVFGIMISSDRSRLGMCCAGDSGHPRMQRVLTDQTREELFCSFALVLFSRGLESDISTAVR